jgi:hypothetical protein
MGKHGQGFDPAGLESLPHDRKGHKLGGTRRHGGLDQDQAVRRDLLTDGPHRGLESSHIHLAGGHVSQAVLQVVALHVDHHAVSEREAVAVVGSRKGLLVEDAPGDHGFNLGVLGLDRREAAVE